MLYMLIYMVMTLGTFACIMAMRRKDGRHVENVDDLAGLSQTNPFMASVLTVLMFSLAGIPPLAGFFAKYFVFIAAIEAHLYALAIIGVLASVVGAYYYLRVIKVMWFDEAKDEFARPSGALRLVYRSLRSLRARLCPHRRTDRHGGRSRCADVLLMALTGTAGCRSTTSGTRRFRRRRIDEHGMPDPGAGRRSGQSLDHRGAPDGRPRSPWPRLGVGTAAISMLRFF